MPSCRGVWTVRAGVVIRVEAAITGLAAVNANLEATQGRVDAAMVRGMRRTVQGGVGIVRGNVSGRPGPRVITGDFRRSWSGDTVSEGSVVFGQIGSNSPQGRRLNYGFDGVDSLGRRYRQPPYPFIPQSEEPIRQLALNEIGSEVQAAFK